MIIPVSIYLAGSIRDGVAEDIQWREDIIDACQDYTVVFFNPLGGKTYDPESRVWSGGGGIPSDAKFITKHDKWCVAHSDIVLFNFRGLSQGYPMIGSLVEFGMAVALDKLVYSIIDPDYTGHENTNMYKLHPFLNEFSAVVCPTVEAMIPALQSRIGVLSGNTPRYRPL